MASSLQRRRPALLARTGSLQSISSQVLLSRRLRLVFAVIFTGAMHSQPTFPAMRVRICRVKAHVSRRHWLSLSVS